MSALGLGVRALETLLPDEGTTRVLAVGGSLAARVGLRREAMLRRIEVMLAVPAASREARDIYRALMLNAFRWQMHGSRPIWSRWMQGASILGLEHVEQALSAGQGALLVGSHVGPYQLLPKIRLRLPWPASRVAMIYTAGSNFSDGVRTRFVRQAYRSLQRHDIVCLMGDGHYGSRAVMARFFGRDVAFASGFARLALSSSAAVIPMFACEVDDRPCVRFEAPLSMPSAMLSARERTELFVQQYVARLETAIRERPDQAVAFFIDDAIRSRERLLRSIGLAT